MSEREKLREIIRKRINYHCDERKHDYRLGKECVDPLINDIVNDMYRAEPDMGIPATENKPLTLEQLREMDGEPVCVLWPGGEVFWCLCQEGWITPPSCIPFAAEDCPRCTFYSQKPKEEGG